jgi:hypothetical protein
MKKLSVITNLPLNCVNKHQYKLNHVNLLNAYQFMIYSGKAFSIYFYTQA